MKKFDAKKTDAQKDLAAETPPLMLIVSLPFVFVYPQHMR
jgi:hypothetical protein